jgi:hypothetical protein
MFIAGLQSQRFPVGFVVCLIAQMSEAPCAGASEQLLVLNMDLARKYGPLQLDWSLRRALRTATVAAHEKNAQEHH